MLLLNLILKLYNYRSMYVLFLIKEFLHFIYFKLHNIDTIEVLISNYISQGRTEPIIRKYLVK